jgi:hypothetical protein
VTLSSNVAAVLWHHPSPAFHALDLLRSHDTVAIGLLASIYLIDILATAFLIPERKGVPLE